jgi:hypothetical protein
MSTKPLCCSWYAAPSRKSRSAERLQGRPLGGFAGRSEGGFETVTFTRNRRFESASLQRRVFANLTWSIRANAIEPGGTRLPLRATHPKSRSGRHGTSCRFSDSRAAEFVPAPIKPIRRLAVPAHQVHRRNVPPCRFVILLPATGSLADNTMLLPFTSHGALLLSPAALRAER